MRRGGFARRSTRRGWRSRGYGPSFLRRGTGDERALSGVPRGFATINQIRANHRELANSDARQYYKQLANCIVENEDALWQCKLIYPRSLAEGDKSQLREGAF